MHFHAMFRIDVHSAPKRDPSFFPLVDYTPNKSVLRARVGCFVRNSSSDRCDHCFAGGKCIRDDLKIANDFQCLYQECSYGHRCDLTPHALALTLDFLLATDSSLVRIIYTCIASLFATIGLFNNLCVYSTFKRPQPRKVSVGNYLFFVSIVNRCALSILLLKPVHIMDALKQSMVADSCILNADDPHISVYILVNTLLNYLFPFAIQTIGITAGMEYGRSYRS